MNKITNPQKKKNENKVNHKQIKLQKHTLKTIKFHDNNLQIINE